MLALICRQFRRRQRSVSSERHSGGALQDTSIAKAPSVRAQQLAALEEEVLRDVQAAVAARVEEVLQSADVQKRIMVRQLALGGLHVSASCAMRVCWVGGGAKHEY